MKDTIWAGKVHKLNYASEVPKGMSQGEGKKYSNTGCRPDERNTSFI
jgi:hypothetical protein